MVRGGIRWVFSNDRIIMDQSAPRGSSTNDAIDGDKYPADMGGMLGVLALINFAGRGSRISKCDWHDAYKHIGINQSQWQYQWFSFAGVYFCEVGGKRVVMNGRMSS